MADINIQRKKSAPSPLWLVVLALALLAAAAWYFLRPDPVEAPASVTADAPAPSDSVDSGSLAPSVRPVLPPADSTAPASAAADYSPATLATQAASDPAAPDYALNGLQKLTGILVALTDRDDLRDPGTTEQRDNLTSATSRLGEPTASLRPGFIAAAGLIRVLQQKAYPALEGPANELVRRAGQLSGRHRTVAEQQQNQQFLTQAAAAVRVLSEPPQ